MQNSVTNLKHRHILGLHEKKRGTPGDIHHANDRRKGAAELIHEIHPVALHRPAKHVEGPDIGNPGVEPRAVTEQNPQTLCPVAAGVRGRRPVVNAAHVGGRPDSAHERRAAANAARVGVQTLDVELHQRGAGPYVAALHGRVQGRP